MFFLRENFSHPEFRQDARDSLSVALGTSAWGLMMGVAIIKSGMGLAAALLMSVLVFAGSSQLAALPLMTAGAPMWVVLANFVPTHWGLGFAGILALLGILCSLASSRLRLISAGVAGAAAVASFALPFKLNILVAIAAAVTLCLILERVVRTESA